MNAVPAKVAGVERIVITVPTMGGSINPAVLAAARMAGVEEIYRIGGAQAIAALAYGTETIAPVYKITGPGNAYVAAAKRHVFGTVGIDMIAGPSEVLVIADKHNDPDWLAADLLAQAEHDEGAQSILITDDAEFGKAVDGAVERQLKRLSRSKTAAASWRDFGAIILVSDLKQAVPLANRIAAEHVELAVDHPDALLAGIRNAGAIFVGRHTPEVIGDYVGGSNHVLPTARSARFRPACRCSISSSAPRSCGSVRSSCAHLARRRSRLPKRKGSTPMRDRLQSVSISRGKAWQKVSSG